MKIGIIGPSEDEIAPFMQDIEKRAEHRHAKLLIHDGLYAGVPVAAVFSGVGKVNAAIATQVLIDRLAVTHIILTGVAGGLDAQLAIGDVVIATEVAHHDVAHEVLTEYHPWMQDIYFQADKTLLEYSLHAATPFHCHCGRIISGEAFIQGEDRQRLVEIFTPLCVDMESASVAQVCHANGIPFAIVRVISDMACADAAQIFEEQIHAASLRALQVVKGVVRQFGSVRSTHSVM